MKTTTLALTAAAVAALTIGAAGVANAQSRDQIRAVGSSTVFPFTTAVAEAFGKTGKFKTPVVESTGTGGGLKLFCGGVGPQHPDIANASRRIKKSEVDQCAANGVAEITELKIGFDGIVMASSKAAKHYDFTRAQVWKALAKEVPVNGKMVANPYKKWSDVDPSLPNYDIEVLGPPPTSGTRDAFNELMMEGGCHQVKEVAAILTDEKARSKACLSIREDGAYVEAGENDNLIVQKLGANPEAFGVFGYSFLDQNKDKLQAAKVDTVVPSYELISSGKYPVSRSLYVYVKNAHVGVIPGIRELIGEYTSERAMGEEGYLADKGLIALPKADRDAARVSAVNLSPLKL
ncbi:PstS family phosphate ABC transporter substrate-binding protein [Azospirillum sp. RWY-5-1]|uniref:PstS family phosphate ABC transporter substrate-binding protein n=1 Tax=Azospirillum oleiclasticum TaxID=2735135 RepID=A0ABX2TAT8_9PROT|nr:PstS family phosphate ABC transporter substrate-binding protein [Azospirillum oleiclasticum]NYZ20362.1 PstS family phosphate ABC transporter substrate-binding protein [Azospirillum oleiclasticum]